MIKLGETQLEVKDNEGRIVSHESSGLGSGSGTGSSRSLVSQNCRVYRHHGTREANALGFCCCDKTP